MSFHLASIIEDKKRILCTLTTSDQTSIEAPTICFSLQAPGTITQGGKKIDGLGGFTVIQLDGTLSPNMPLKFTLAFEDPYFLLSNRAWHPQGPYLRLSNGTAEIAMDIPLGPRSAPAPPVVMPASGIALTPAPHDWQPSSGTLRTTGFRATGAYVDTSQTLEELCKRRSLASLLQGETPLNITTDATIPAAGYRVAITQNDISLTASDQTGVFYGLITVLTLQHTHDGIPCGIITDAPRFEWRGFMLDCVREFYPVSAICKLLDLMAIMKLNRFHWHFADDEAVRLQTKTAPELWQKSEMRGEGQVIPGVFGGRAGPTGGSYSAPDVTTILTHAAALHIEVLPEIEVPAHALALTAILPHLRDPEDTGTELSVQGYHRNVVNPAITDTWALLEPLSYEVAGLFPFKHLHLGGDELPDQTWSGSPLIDDYKSTHTLTTHQDVQGHMMHRLAGHIAKSGITPCAWQEAADGCTGGVGHDAILFSWTGAGPGREAAARGHRVVMCPAQHCYFDMAHTAEEHDWGANWAATFALDKAYDWNPIPDASVADKIIGVQGTFWSEFTSDAKDYEAMIAPRILGLATKAWSMDEVTTLDDLRRTATCYMSFFSAMGWHAHGDAIWTDTPDDAVRRVDA